MKNIFTDIELTKIKENLNKYEHLGFNITWGSILGYPLNKATKYRSKYFEEVQNDKVTYSKNLFKVTLFDLYILKPYIIFICYLALLISN